MEIDLKYKNLEAKRFSLAKGPVNINNNSTVTSLSKEGVNLELDFVFTSRYEPNVGLVKIEGELSLTDNKERIEKIMEVWKETEEKNLPQEVAENVHNAILANCIVEATVLSRDIQLPPPIPTPKVSIGKEGEKGEGEFKADYIR